MKIDFLISAMHGGGAERVLALIANQLETRGHQVSIITFNPANAYQINRNIKRVNLHHGNINNHKLRSLINLGKYYKKKENRPQVLISFITHNNLLAVLIGKFFKIKVIISEHNNHLQRQQPIWLTKFTRRFIYRRADLLTVLTAYDVDYYKNLGANVVIMPNPSTFEPITQWQKTRKKTILAVGNLNRYNHKGFDNLIELIAPILIQFPEWKLQIIGSGDDGLRILKDLAIKKDVKDKIEFLGFKDNVQEIMQDSEIFILSSRFEGLPMVLIEAMSQGMACVAYNCITGPSDIIDHNINGLLVPDQNKEAMQEALIELIENDALRIKLQKESPKRVEDFDIDIITDKWESQLKAIEI